MYSYWLSLSLLLLLLLSITEVQAQGICSQYTEYRGYSTYYIGYRQESTGTCSWSWIFQRCYTRYFSVSRYGSSTSYYPVTVIVCCSGYSKSGSSCNPICSPSCLNGGICTAPYTCKCPEGYTGAYCQHSRRVLFSPNLCPLTTSEDNSKVTLCLTVTNPFSQWTSVPLQITDGSATVGKDTFRNAHYAVFASGMTEACVNIAIIDDDDCELTESFTVSVVAQSTYGVMEPRSCTVQITDNDRVKVSFEQSVYRFDESTKDTDVCIRASCPCPKKMDSLLTLTNGTAKAGFDYTEQSLSVAFDVDEVKTCTGITLTDDLIPENMENFQIKIVESDEYDIISPHHSTVIVTDSDKFCETLPTIPGIEYLGLNGSKPLYIGAEVPYRCKQGFEIIDSATKGLQALAKCKRNFWKIERHCFDIQECRNEVKVCEKHCKETAGSYQCFCDSGEKLDDNGFSCEKECGHITVPDGVNTSYAIIQGIQVATLSCIKAGYVFAGGKDPTPQLCIKGQWTYQAYEYEIPSCQVSEESVAVGEGNVSTNISCDSDEKLICFISSHSDVIYSCTCKSDGKKRSTDGHIVLHFRVETVIPKMCKKETAEFHLYKLRPTILRLFNILRSGNLCLNITDTVTNYTRSVCVRSEPKLTFIGQTCRKGQVFKNCECIPCAPGTYYNSTSARCQFCPKSEYQSDSGQTSCTTCPNGKTTRRRGTYSLNGCIELCKPGHFSTEGDGYEPCLPCPDGSWQNETGASFCYACDYDQKTGREGAISSRECGCLKDSILQDCALSCSCKNGGSCLENGFCVCPSGWGGYDCSYQECPPHLSCFPGVACVFGEDNDIICGSCPDGLTGDGIKCHPIPCILGSKYNIENNTCELCPLSQYQDEIGQTSCKTCPNGTMTLEQGTNSLVYCITECAPGSFYNKTEDMCYPCPMSQYQNESGKQSCETCPNIMITRREGTNSSSECIDLCPVGEYSIEGDGYGPCDFCPDGSWQNETGMSFCYNCTNSTHTGGKGATSSNECGLCHIGQYSIQFGSNGYEPCELCPDGSWQNETGTSFCYSCNSGHHTGREGAISYNECEECEPGSFYNQTKKRCQPCPLSQYQDESGRQSCKTCPSETITRREGTNSSSGCIEMCQVGEYSAEGDGHEPCELCPNGSWQNETGMSFCYNCTNSTHTGGRKGATSSNECGQCHIGQYSIQFGSNGYEPCELCPDGSWQNETGASFCYSCESGHHTGREGAISYNECEECEPGSFYNKTEKICQPCPLSQYQNESGRQSCKTCPSKTITRREGTNSSSGCLGMCQVGEYSTEGDGHKPCELCPNGSWQNETGMSFCFNCTNSTYTGRKGATSFNDCGLCQIGQYSIGSNGYGPCLPCPDGTWQNETGASFCYSCDNGHHTGREGAISYNECEECEPGSFYNKIEKRCQPCPLSQYQDESGRQSCKICPSKTITRREGTNSSSGCIGMCQVGEYSTEGDGHEPCELCPNGSWQNDTGMSFCYNCTNITYTGRKGATSFNECGQCQIGQYSIGSNGSQPCLPCPDGTWQNETGASFCHACDHGYHTAMEGAISNNDCAQCSAGSFYNSSDMLCELCPLSQYQEESGRTSCTPCPKGLFTTNQGTVLKERCVGCDTFCHPSVGCQLDVTTGVICDDCPEDLTGNGETCYPVCAGMASSIYLASFMVAYQSFEKHLLIMSPDNTTITIVSDDGAETSVQMSQQLRGMTVSSSTKTIAICTDVNSSIAAIGIYERASFVSAFSAVKISNVLHGEYYIAVSPDTSSKAPIQNRLLISAFYDNTEVEFLSNSEIMYTMSGRWNSSKFNGRYITLHKMDFITISATTDVSGTEFRTTKPVSFVSGHQCASIPLGVAACDPIVEQIPPVSAWGTFFTLSAFKRDGVGDIVKIIASKSHTTITVTCWNNNNSKILLQNQLDHTEHLSFELSTSDTCLLNSSSPVLVVQFSTGGALSPTKKGDPSMALVPHLGQYFASGQTGFISPGLEEHRTDYEHFANIFVYYPSGLAINNPLFDGVDIITDGNFEEIILGQHQLPTALQGSIGIYKGSIGPGPHTIETVGHVSVVVYGYHTWEMYSYAVADI